MNKKFNVWYPQGKQMIESGAPGVLIHLDGEINSLDENGMLVGTDNAGEGVIIPFTGLTDQDDNELHEGDVTSLEVDGETRYFKVAIKTVVRELVSHPSFSDETAKVAITAVVFEWNGFELFPCVDKNGVPDNKRMKKVGNIYENPELLYEGGK